jgi:ribosomal protein S18 acetylase RimI-like enzyme
MTAHDISIRRAGKADLAPLSDLLAASYATLDDGSYDRAEFAAALPLMSRANPTLVASGRYFVAEIGGRPAACGGWSLGAPWTGEIVEGVGHIRHFATHPAFRGHGAGGALLRHCLAEADAAGVRLMMCQASLPGVAFYERFGFSVLRRVITNVGGNPLPAIEMEKRLGRTVS